MLQLGYLLWGLLFLGSIGTLVLSWVRHRSTFDIFEAKNIFLIVFFVYYGIPSLYYLIFNPSFPGIIDTGSSLRLVLAYSVIGLLGFYLGYKVRIAKKFDFLPRAWDATKLSLVAGGFSAIAVLSGLILSQRVGGVCYYVTHLGQTNVLLVGNIYLVWGLLLFKLVALVLLTYYFSSRPKGWGWKALVISSLLLSAVIVTTLGARLLLVVYIVEILVVFHYLWKKIGLLFLSLCTVFIIIFIVGVLGEYRTFTWSAPQICSVSSASIQVPKNLKGGLILSNPDKKVASSPSSSPASSPTTSRSSGSSSAVTSVQAGNFGESFATQVGITSSDWRLVAERYINNYFDSVLTTMVVIDNTPKNLSYQYGIGYLSLLVQPLPRAIRPALSLPSDGNQDNKISPSILSGGTGYSRILSLLGEAYLNFSIFGILLIPFMIGILSRFAYDFFVRNRENAGAVLLYAIFVGGLLMEVRGYFVGAGSFFLMDLVPIVLILLWFKRSAKVQ